MGYDPSRFDGSVDDELKCPICCFVLQDAVQAPDCEHTFCQECINEWLSRQHNCPVDRRTLTRGSLKPAPRVLRNFLAKLDIKCDFASGGCPAVVKLELLQSHTDTCDFNPYKPVICEKGCGFVLLRNQVEGHNCLSDLRELISKQETQINDLKASKTVQAEQLADLKGSLKRIQDHELTEHSRQIHHLQQQVSRMSATIDSLTQKQQQHQSMIVQHQQHMLQQQQSPSSCHGEDCDGHHDCDCDNDNSNSLHAPRSCLFSSQAASCSSSGIPRKRIHSSWKGKDFPAKRMPSTSTATASSSGGKPCHAYMDMPSPCSNPRSAPSPYSETEILRHNYYHHSHSSHDRSERSCHTAAASSSTAVNPQSPEDNQNSASPATPGYSSLHTQLITFYGQVITVNLSEEEIVEDVKVKIDRKEGIPVEQQLLFFAGQQLEDDKPLTFYQIFNSSATETSRHLVLRLRDGMKIFVKTLSDKTIEVQVDPSETIEIVKVKIHEQEGISPCDQRLLQDGRDLADLRTLSDYGIKHKSTLQLDLHLGGPCPICQSQFRNSSTNTPMVFPGSVSPPSASRNSTGKGSGHVHSNTSTVSCPGTNVTNTTSSPPTSPPSCSPRK